MLLSSRWVGLIVVALLQVSINSWLGWQLLLGHIDFSWFRARGFERGRVGYSSGSMAVRWVTGDAIVRGASAKGLGIPGGVPRSDIAMCIAGWRTATG